MDKPLTPLMQWLVAMCESNPRMSVKVNEMLIPTGRKDAPDRASWFSVTVTLTAGQGEIQFGGMGQVADCIEGAIKLWEQVYG